MKQLSPPDLKQLMEELRQQELRFDKRFDDVVAKFHKACADYDIMRQRYENLQAKLSVKQEIIELLLFYYPHPLTPELQAKIDLA